MSISGQVEALPIPETGPVLFVLRVPDPAGDHTREDLEACAASLRQAGQKVAPGRGHAVILVGDIRLEALSEAELRGLGLQHISTATSDLRQELK